MDVQTVVQRNEAAFTRLDDAYLAIDAQAGYLYSLNPTAGKIWDMLHEPVRVDRLCADLRERFDVDEATCRRDVVALLTELRDLGYVRVLE